MSLTNLSAHTINDWTYLFREVCSHAIANLPPLVGTNDKPMQIIESYFRGRRKANTVRFLLVNQYEGNTQNPGLWIFGLATCAEDVRFIMVPNRSAQILLSIVSENVVANSTIFSDEWASYNRLLDMGYDH